MMKKVLLLALVMMVYAPIMPAHAQWKVVKKFVQKDTKIIEETEDHIILYNAELDATIRVTVADMPEGEIEGHRRIKRGGNPFIKWFYSERFWGSSEIPKSEWSKFFRSAFLALIQPPEKKKTK